MAARTLRHRERSLRRVSRRELVDLGGPKLQERAWRWAHREIPYLVAGGASALAIGVIAYVGLFLPFSYRIPAETPSRALTFLATLWQVEAAILGLTVAITLFLFQSFAGSVLRVPIRDSVLESYLMPFLFLGIVSVLTDGFVLLDLGGPATGWAGSWATIVTLAAMASLFPMIFLAIRSMDPDVVLRRWARRGALMARHEADLDLLRRVAANVLIRECDDARATVLPQGMEPINPTSVLAGRSGVVYDIDLHSVRVLARRVLRETGAQLELTVRLGDRVSLNETLLALPAGSSALSELDAHSVVRIAR